MNCTYNRATRQLTVFSPVSEDTDSTYFAFQVKNFRNPYSGKTRTNYTIVTTDN